MNESPAHPLGLAGRLAQTFLFSKLTVLAVLASLLLGLFASWNLPREEEPQIKVPMIDVWVSLPGADPSEVESRLTRPLERWLWEIPDAEYIYSSSSSGSALVILRFKVGTDVETALVRVQQRLEAHRGELPAESSPQVKPRTIDDVPILALTLHSASAPTVDLRRLASQVAETLGATSGVAEIQLIGGGHREVRLDLDPAALQAHQLTSRDIADSFRALNQRALIGAFPLQGVSTQVMSGAWLASWEDLQQWTIPSAKGPAVPVTALGHLHQDAAEPDRYVLHRTAGGAWHSAVTLTFAKRPGVNAIEVVDALLAKIPALRAEFLPAAVELTVTRDYGHTAAEKSNELLLHMGIAVVGVSLLILLFLGWRESGVVLLAIPTTLALTLLVFFLHGYTLNRITLFALIFSIGILVDDAIVVVENIVRHYRRPENEGRPAADIVVMAVDEVGNSTLLATWAVIAAILPMAFVGGLMGPYMRPIPVGSTAAMLFSVAIAFTVTPWAALRILRRHGHGPAHEETAPTAETADWSTRLYYRIMRPLIDHKRARLLFFAVILALLVGAAALVPFGAVKIKMLPFDNKSELQLILNTPETMSLEDTLRLATAMANEVSQEPEVAHVQVYAGTAAPFNFNGLVRHYFMRQGPNVADVQINLVAKEDRRAQSHDIALRIRPRVAALAAQVGASVAVAEVPPGPPVLQTLVAEIYSPREKERTALAAEVKRIFAATPGVTDIDWYVEETQPRLHYQPKTAHLTAEGLSTADVNRLLSTVWAGENIGFLRDERAQETVPLRIAAPRTLLETPETLLSYSLRSPTSGSLLPLGELVSLQTTTVPRTLYRKNLQPVTYVTADVEGDLASPAYALAQLHPVVARLDATKFGGKSAELTLYHLHQPEQEVGPAVKWDGEWHVTLEVFRDLGIAFAVVLILIAMLMVGWFKNYRTPLVVMTAIPFSLIGILPAHWAFGAFFTATSMIGFMAGAGIVVRNSIILVDFIEQRRREGIELHAAVLEAGAVRFRPMLLTALAVVVGASVILTDPIFQGLALSLMFGEIASLLVSRLAVPILYAWTEEKTLFSHENQHRQS